MFSWIAQKLGISNSATSWAMSTDERIATATIEGVDVNSQTAIGFAPLFRAIAMIAEDVASCPLQLHRTNNEPGQSSLMRGHSTNFVVSRRWNQYTTAYRGWRDLIAQSELTGSGYAYIVRQNGLLKELWNLDPRWVSHHIDPISRKEYYTVTIRGETADFDSDEILHVRGLALRNGKAVDPVETLGRDLTLALGLQEYSLQSARRGFRTPSVLHVPPGTPAEARQRLESQVQKSATKKEHWLNTLVLRDGATLHELGQDNSKAALIELHEQQTRQIALFYGIPVSRFGLRNSVSYGSAAQDTAQYLSNTLLSRFRSIAAECDHRLLPSRDYRSGNYEFRHDTSKLVESDVVSLSEVLHKQRAAGIVTANEARAKLGYGASDDAAANSLISPYTQSA
jgi:HK97 family phage portal protein